MQAKCIPGGGGGGREAEKEGPHVPPKNNFKFFWLFTDCPFDFESIMVYDRGSQPLGIGVPPNGKISVNLTFCVIP
jgi:hypothetical protein